MKKAFITIALLIVAMSASAQAEQKDSTTYKREGKTFVQVESVILQGDCVTSYTWRDTKGNEYPIILHTYTKGEKKGRTTAYVVRTSAKSGKQYRYFLPAGENIAKDIIEEGKR